MNRPDDRSEDYLGSEIKLPRDREDPERSDHALRARAVDTRRSWIARRHVIECIVSIHPELPLDILPNGNFLLQSQIHIP